MFKITWNVVVDKGLGRIGIGIIVRDHDGSILAACGTTKNYCRSSSSLTGREMEFYKLLMQLERRNKIGAILGIL
jgi:hypothetical protein